MKGRTLREFAPILLLACFCLEGVREGQALVIDPGLAAAIGDALAKPASELTESDLLGLKVLNANRRDVASLAGLEAAINLESLTARYNRLSMAALPRTLTKLTTLDLSYNQLTNVTLPAELTNLTAIDLSHNLLTEFVVPPTLTKLESLDLYSNPLVDFRLPQGLASLRSLLLAGAGLRTVDLPDDLSSLTNLYITYFSWSNPHRTPFALPSGLTNLATLNIGGGLLDFSLPPDLASLQHLSFGSVSITNFSFLANLPRPEKLITLAIANSSKVTNLALPRGLASLTTLTFVGNSDLTAVALSPDLTSLTNLNIFGNKLASLELPSLPKLRELLFYQDSPFTVQFAGECPELAAVNIGSPGPTDLAPLASLTNLSSIRASGSPIVNFAAVSDFPGLNLLSIKGLQADDLVLLPKVAESTELRLSPSQLKEFVASGKLANLRSLVLSGSVQPDTDFSLLNDLPLLRELTLEASESYDPVAVDLPVGLTNLAVLRVHYYGLGELRIPPSLSNLTTLDIRFSGRLTNVVMPPSLAKLSNLDLGEGTLRDLSFLRGLSSLNSLRLSSYGLTNVTLPEGLTSLNSIDISYSSIESLVLPPDATALTNLGLEFIIQLRSVVMSESVAVGSLAGEVARLKEEGVSVLTYPSSPKLSGHRPAGAAGPLEFTVQGPPGAYSILRSTNLTEWDEYITLTNSLGRAGFSESQGTASSRGFYQARLKRP